MREAGKPTKAKLNWLPKATPMPYPFDDGSDPAEAMRAKCEAIIRDNVPVYGSHEGSYMQRRRDGDRMGLPYADAIAALKGT